MLAAVYIDVGVLLSCPSSSDSLDVMSGSEDMKQGFCMLLNSTLLSFKTAACPLMG